MGAGVATTFFWLLTSRLPGVPSCLSASRSAITANQRLCHMVARGARG